MQKIANISPPLPTKWEHLCQHYVMHGSILKATKDLRMNRSSVTKLLRDPRIAKRIQEIQAAEFQDLGITAERVKEELARVAFASAAGLFDEEGRLIGVLDLDSPDLNRFDQDDLAGCEALAEVIVRHLG